MCEMLAWTAHNLHRYEASEASMGGCEDLCIFFNSVSLTNVNRALAVTCRIVNAKCIPLFPRRRKQTNAVGLDSSPYQERGKFEEITPRLKPAYFPNLKFYAHFAEPISIATRPLLFPLRSHFPATPQIQKFTFTTVLKNRHSVISHLAGKSFPARSLPTYPRISRDALTQITRQKEED